MVVLTDFQVLPQSAHQAGQEEAGVPTPGDKRHMGRRGSPADLVSFSFLSSLCSWLSVSLPLDQAVEDKDADRLISSQER